MATDFTSYLGVKFKFDSAEARADIVKLLNDLDYFEKKLKGNFDTKAITDWNNKIDIAKQGLNEFGVQVDTVTQQSYQNFRAIGQMDRITREFASGGLTSGLNGLTMFGNSLTRLAVQEGGFKNAITGLATAFTGPAGIVLALSAAVGIFEQWQKTSKKAEEENIKFAKSLDDAKKSGLETGLRLQTLITISEDATLSDKKRAEALASVKKELGGVNKELADQIKTSDDAKKAVDTYTQALIQQAVVTARMGKIAADTIALESSQTTIAKSKPSDIGKVLALQANEQLGGQTGLGASLLIKALGLSDLANALDESKRLQKELDNQTDALKNDIKGLEANPFGLALLTGQEGPSKSVKIVDEAREENKKLRLELELQKEYKKKFSELGLDIIKIPTLSETNADEAKRKASIQKDIKPVEERMAASGGLGDVLAKQAEKSAQQIKLDDEIAKGIKAQQEAYKSLAKTISQDVTKSLFNMYDAMQQGQSFGEAFLNMISQLVQKMAELVIQTLIFDAIFAALTAGGSIAAEAGGVAASDVAGSAGRMLMIPKYAEGGITTKAHIGMIGEAGPEAIMPLSKLGSMMNSTFSAGAMSGGNMGSNGQFTLKGSDLVLALQRSNYSLNLRRGS